jgi:hypothetical protein
LPTLKPGSAALASPKYPVTIPRPGFTGLFFGHFFSTRQELREFLNCIKLWINELENKSYPHFFKKSQVIQINDADQKHGTQQQKSMPKFMIFIMLIDLST